MFENKTNFKKRSVLLFIIVFFIFNLKNVNRIYKEINRTDKYAYKDFPFSLLKIKNIIRKYLIIILTFIQQFIIAGLLRHLVVQ